MSSVIYDFGSNNGDDLAYYLKKADRVVAVEANPVLCEQICRRFPLEIASGRLAVESKVLTSASDQSEVQFFVHKTNHVLSQFPEPECPQHFERVLLPSCSPVDLIKKHGPPHYIKIDIEHYDEPILRALFEAGIHPPFISAESHSVEIFAVLLAIGGYSAFKLVDGLSVPNVYGNTLIETRGGVERFTFTNHSAGPFGDDIEGSWLSPSVFFQVLAREGLGWKDIHASSCREAGEADQIGWRLGARMIRQGAGHIKRSLRRRIHHRQLTTRLGASS